MVDEVNNKSSDNSTVNYDPNGTNLFKDATWYGQLGVGAVNHGSNVYGSYTISGNYQLAQPLLTPETYANRLELISTNNWQSLSDVATPGTSSHTTASMLANTTKYLNYGTGIFGGFGVMADGYNAYQVSGGDNAYTAAYTASSATWNFGGGAAAVGAGCAAGSFFFLVPGCAVGGGLGFAGHFVADYFYGDEIKSGLAEGLMVAGPIWQSAWINGGEEHVFALEPGIVAAHDGSWTRYTYQHEDGSYTEIIELGDQIINRRLTSDGQLIEQRSAPISTPNYELINNNEGQTSGEPSYPSTDAHTTPSHTSSSTFRDWVAEHHPEHLANLNTEGEFLYRSADAGTNSHDGQSDYAAAREEIDALREQYQAAQGDSQMPDGNWNHTTGNFDDETLAFIAEAEREFQLQDNEAEARSQEAAAHQQQLAPQEPGLIDGFNNVVGGAGEWLGETLTNWFGPETEDSDNPTTPVEEQSPEMAQLNALNSILMFQQALMGDNAFAQFTGGVATVNALNQAGWIDLGDSSRDWGELGSNLGFVTGALNLYESFQSGDTASMVRSAASLGAQATSMYAASASAAGNAAAASSARAASSALGTVAGVVGIYQALEAGDTLGAVIAVITMINPVVGMVLSLARAIFGGADEPPPPTARSVWEYDMAQGGFVPANDVVLTGFAQAA